MATACIVAATSSKPCKRKLRDVQLSPGGTATTTCIGKIDCAELQRTPGFEYVVGDDLTTLQNLFGPHRAAGHVLVKIDHNHAECSRARIVCTSSTINAYLTSTLLPRFAIMAAYGSGGSSSVVSSAECAKVLECGQESAALVAALAKTEQDTLRVFLSGASAIRHREVAVLTDEPGVPRQFEFSDVITLPVRDILCELAPAAGFANGGTLAGKSSDSGIKSFSMSVFATNPSSAAYFVLTRGSNTYCLPLSPLRADAPPMCPMKSMKPTEGIRKERFAASDEDTGPHRTIDAVRRNERVWIDRVQLDVGTFAAFLRCHSGPTFDLFLNREHTSQSGMVGVRTVHRGNVEHELVQAALDDGSDD